MGRKESNKKNVFPGSDNFGSNPLYFTFCIITLPDMSSADNLWNSLEPDQAQQSVQAWLGFKLFAKVISRWQCEFEPMYFIFALNLYMLITLSNNLEPDQAWHSVRTW